jgi:hypothetical protein
MRSVLMRVTFGWRLDSRQGPLNEARFNEPVVGRQGLLGLIELYLGLAGPIVTRPRRVAVYLRHLRQADDGHRFYSRSLQVDEVGVASELLDWRDLWLLHGWDGSASAAAPNRIVDMAAVESTARGQVPPGEAERLHQVFLRAISSEARDGSELASRLSSSTSRVESAQAAYAKRQAVAERLSTARGAGQEISVDLAQLPINSDFMQRYMLTVV